MIAKKGIYVDDIDTVYITGAGYVRKAFKNIGRDTIGYNEVVWASNLTRTNTFALENIDDVDFGYVPQLQLHIPFMNIDDFLILQAMLRERHVIVDYFDVDYGKRVVHEMAIAKNERKKIYAFKKHINGVYDFQVNFVGTNRDGEMLNNYTITYNANGGVGTIANNNVGNYHKSKEDSQWYHFSDQVTLSSGEGFSKTGYHLASWNTSADGTGSTYLPNQSITIYQNLVLYAIWE